jgi:hypothetical protein
MAESERCVVSGSRWSAVQLVGSGSDVEAMEVAMAMAIRREVGMRGEGEGEESVKEAGTVKRAGSRGGRGRGGGQVAGVRA